MRLEQLKDRPHWINLLFISLLFLSGFYVQSQLYASPDVTWLLYMTKKMLAGQQYGRDIFETNPPLILWLSVPPVLLQRILHLNVYRIFLVYIYAVTLLSLSLCFSLLARAYPENRGNISARVLQVTLTAAVLFLPLYAFGQRDVLWMMLILPWMGGAVCRLTHRPVPVWQAVTAGLLAGLGFALKPYFLCVLCLVELYVMFDSRRLSGWWRTETAMILAVFFLYLGAIAAFQPGYFDTVLPLVMRYYFIAAHQPWTAVLTLSWMLFAASVAVYYIIFRAYDRYPAQGRVLLLVLTGMILSCVLARVPWYYHACPALVLGYVLLAYLTVQMILPRSGKNENVYSMLVPLTMAGLMMYFPLATIIQGLPEVGMILQPVEAVARIIQSEKQTGDTINALSIHTTADTILPAEMAGADYVSGMPFYWWYAGLLASEMDHLQSTRRLSQDRAFLTDVIVREVTQSKPQWLVINQTEVRAALERFHKRHSPGWLHNLMQNPRLQESFRCYQFYALSGHFQIYKRLDACAGDKS